MRGSLKYSLFLAMFPFAGLFFINMIRAAESLETIHSENIADNILDTWTKLTEKYRKEGISISYSDTNSDNNTVSDHTVWICGDCQLSRVSGKLDKSEYIRSMNSSYAFEIASVDGDRWTIENISDSPEGVLAVGENLNLFSPSGIIFSGLIVDECWLKDLVHDKSFSITSFHASKENGSVTIEFAADYQSAEAGKVKGGSIELIEIGGYYLIKHSEMTVCDLVLPEGTETDSYSITRDNEYKMIGDTPYPAVVKSVIQRDDKTFNFNLVFDDVKIGKIPLKIFSLKYYGLQEPHHVGTAQRYTSVIFWVRYVVVFLGVILIALGIYLHRRAAKAGTP